jgi:hypothetical protein
VIEALNVVIKFLSFFDGTIDHRQPLVSLINALASLEEGNVLPSSTSPARQAPRDTALAAGTVHRLCQTGLDPEEAYAMVAKACRDSGMNPERSGAKDRQGQEPEITGRTVRGWCEKTAEDVGHHLQAAQTSDRLRQCWATKAQAITQAIENKGIEAVRNDLLEGLRRSLVEMRAPEH